MRHERRREAGRRADEAESDGTGGATVGGDMGTQGRIALTGLVVAVVTACGGGSAASSAGAVGGDPTATVKDFVALVEAKRYAAVADVACAAQKDTIARRADLGSGLTGTLQGVDGAAITDAMTTKFDDLTYTVASQSSDAATVTLAGTLTMAYDKAKMTALVKKALGAQGTSIDDATIASMLDSKTTALQHGRPIDWAFDLVTEGGRWLICGLSESASPAP
jgi:hypothetical protein